jgi:hypothetical protein
MLYLIDANVLITAHNYYYPVDAVPEFWEWLCHHGAAGRIKMPIEIFEEIKDGSQDDTRDLLFDWIQDAQHKSDILLDEQVDPALVRQVTEQGYAPDLLDDEIEQIGRDPFLIAYALGSPAERCVVSNESSAPRKQRQNRRFPTYAILLESAAALRSR